MYIIDRRSSYPSTVSRTLLWSLGRKRAAGEKERANKVSSRVAHMKSPSAKDLMGNDGQYQRYEKPLIKRIGAARTLFVP